MRGFVIGVLVALGCDASTFAQDRDRAVERMTLALQQPGRLTVSPSMVDVDRPIKLGVFTFVQPQLRGEMVRVSLPVGGFAMAAARSVGAANQRRQEAAARRRVNAAVKEFEQQRRRSRQ